MRMKWITVPAFLAGLLTLATVDSQGQPPGFGGRDRGGDGDRSRGGRGGFSRGGFNMDPNAMWDRMSRGQDSINLNDPQHAFMKRMMERRGEPMPPNGILTRQQFVAGMQQRMAQAQRGPDGGPGRFTPPGGSPNMRTFQATPGPDGKPIVTMQGGPPGMRGMQRVDGRGDRGSSNSSDPRSQSSSDRNQKNNSKNKDEEEERPVVYRYGKLPKGLPSWFEELDTDQDGQVGLYEWRRNRKPTSEFVDFDLNADGYLTAGEWLRHEKLAIERRATASTSQSQSGTFSFGGGPGQTGGMRVPLQSDGKNERGDRPRRPSREKKRNPFTGN